MKHYNVVINGTSPLLFNKPAELGFDKTFVEKMASPDHDAEMLQRFYTDKNMNICTPGIHIERSLIAAGKKLRVKGAGKATYSKIFGSMLSVSPDLIIHQFQEYTVHKSLVVIPSTKGRILRCRPMLERWQLDFTVSVEEEDISDEVVKEALKIAGKFCGIGDWRPEKAGKFGKFETISFKEIR